VENPKNRSYDMNKCLSFVHFTRNSTTNMQCISERAARELLPVPTWREL
jgi:hypothetical protein